MWCGTQRKYLSELSPERIHKLESLEGWTWDILETSWNDNLKTALEIYSKNQATKLRDIATFGDKSFKQWLARQRKQLKEGQLSEERKIKLAPIIHLLTNDPLKSQWEKYFEELAAFSKTYGHINLSEDAKVDGLYLSRWVMRQRTRYKLNTISRDEIRALESIPGWKWDPSKDNWDATYLWVKQYIAENGHILMHQDEYPTINFCLNGQRKLRRRGTILPEREKLLESLPGWSWNPAELSLEKAISEATAYVVANGHLNLKPEEHFNGFPLSKWLKVVRTYKSKGLLSDEAITKISKIPLWNWGRNHKE
jgi:hypothetical protein